MMHCVVMLCVALYCIVLRCVALCCVALCCVALCCVVLCCVALCCVALCCVALCCVALSCVALCCVALSCVALSCVVLCLSCVLIVSWLCPGCVLAVSFEVSSGKTKDPNWCRAGLIQTEHFSIKSGVVSSKCHCQHARLLQCPRLIQWYSICYRLCFSIRCLEGLANLKIQCFSKLFAARRSLQHLKIIVL